MKKYNVCIIGAGNISNTRHIPALKLSGMANIHGVIGISKENVQSTCTKHKISNSFIINRNESYIEQFSRISWFKDIDAVVIGVPPHEHYNIAKACLLLEKNVLVEKPMVMNTDQAKELIELSEQKDKVFYVMHNFQYANNFIKLRRLLDSHKLGNIVSFFEVQFTNRDRRLPEWYNELPLGLFYDEAAHFFYLLESLGGEVKVLSGFCQYDQAKSENTPMLLSANMAAGKYPVNLFVNFNSPVCEWLFIVSCEKKLAVYDFFRDILILIPNDGQHYAKDVLRSSWSFTIQHWVGFVKNGFKMVFGNLLYGQDKVMKYFLESINTKNRIENINCTFGYKNVAAMNDIINAVKTDKK